MTSNGSPPPYEELYKMYSPKVLAYIRGKVTSPSDAEDLLSCVFIKILEKYESFDSSKASVSTWIYTITHNTVCDFYRKHARQGNMVYIDETEMEIVSDEDIDEGYIRQESLKELADALEQLPRVQRDIVILRYFHGYPLNKAAEQLKLGESNAKYHHQKAMEKLRFLLGGKL